MLEVNDVVRTRISGTAPAGSKGVVMKQARVWDRAREMFPDHEVFTTDTPKLRDFSIEQARGGDGKPISKNLEIERHQANHDSRTPAERTGSPELAGQIR